MLRRRSIRTKIFAGFSLLGAVVVLLFASGNWGLNRYKMLSRAVSHSAKEIQLANKLHRQSVSLALANKRLEDFDRQPEMLEANGLGKLELFEDLKSTRREMAEDQFNDLLSSLTINLESYEALLARTGDNADILVNQIQHSRRVSDIRDALKHVVMLRVSPQDPKTFRNDLEEALGKLVSKTHGQAEAINDAMAGFSAEVKSEYRTRIAVSWICLMLALTLVGLLVWCFWTLIVQPFRTLLEGSRLVANEGAFGHRISLGTGDELDELASAMNAMSNRFLMVFNHSEQQRQNAEKEVRARTREVIRNEQLASVGFLAAGVAHEINNPLTTIAWGAESLESEIKQLRQMDVSEMDEDVATYVLSTLQQIQSEAFRCKGITERLLDFSRMGEVRREATDIAELVGQVVELVGNVGEFRCKKLRVHASGDVIAEVSSHQIRQVVLNLVTNALESVDYEGSVDVSVFADDNHARIVVEDDGCGMSEEVMKHLFEPFFTRRRDGTGTGLGLSITYRIVSQHGGSLVPHSEGEGKGSRLEVTLPLAAASEDTFDSTMPTSSQGEAWMAAANAA